MHMLLPPQVSSYCRLKGLGYIFPLCTDLYAIISHYKTKKTTLKKNKTKYQNQYPLYLTRNPTFCEEAPCNFLSTRFIEWRLSTAQQLIICFWPVRALSGTTLITITKNTIFQGLFILKIIGEEKNSLRKQKRKLPVPLWLIFSIIIWICRLNADTAVRQGVGLNQPIFLPIYITVKAKPTITTTP